MSDYPEIDAKIAQMLYGAVRHVLNRVQTEPEFRWHMLGTESLDRLVRAEAAFTGRSEQEVRAERETDRQPDYRRRRAECAHNRDRVRDLEALLEEHGIEPPSMESACDG